METDAYIKGMTNKYSLAKLQKMMEGLKGTKVLVIGDSIIDHYVFTKVKGRAIKDPILSTEFENEEEYAGGAIIVANHAASFVKEVKLVTLVGDRDQKIDFIKASLGKNVQMKAFTKPDSFTNIKKRFIESNRNNKLFKIEYMNDRPVSEELSSEIIAYLDKELPKYDLVIAMDFGHGFINSAIKRKLEEKSKFLAVNAQSNSANMGYNYHTLYKKADFRTMNEEELRLSLSMRFEPVDELIGAAQKDLEFKSFIVTHGKKGCSYCTELHKTFKAPVLTTNVKDTVGAGDALFAISSLFRYAKVDEELIPFFANCAGGIAANIMGNKEAVDMEKMTSFLKEIGFK